MAREISVAIPQLTGGGAEKITTRLAARLHAEQGLSCLYTGDRTGAELLAGLPIVDLKAPRALQAVPSFLRLVGEDPAAAFLLTLGYINLAPLVRLRRRRARVVLRIGNTPGPELKLLSPLGRARYLASMRLALHTADAVVVQSRYMGQDLCRLFPGIEEKLVVIYNFVEDELWEWRAPDSPPVSKPYLFCAASMKPQKGLDVLLAAFARSDRRRLTRLVVAGVYPANSAFTQIMVDNGLGEDEVLRLGFVPAPYAWIAHSESCVLASRFEGFSNFLLEAAALGKRIVATDCPGGNAELFQHYPNVEAVPVEDVQALAGALDGPRNDVERSEARSMLAPFDEQEIYDRYVDVLTAGRPATVGA